MKPRLTSRKTEFNIYTLVGKILYGFYNMYFKLKKLKSQKIQKISLGTNFLYLPIPLIQATVTMPIDINVLGQF